jgi:hypothetical protein
MMLMTRWLRRIMLCGDAVVLFAVCLAATSLGAAAQPEPKTWSRFAVPAHPIAGGVHHLQVHEPVGYSWPLKLDSNGVPELGTASVGTPVTATSGTVPANVSLTAAGFPDVVSKGPIGRTGRLAAVGDQAPGRQRGRADGEPAANRRHR